MCVCVCVCVQFYFWLRKNTFIKPSVGMYSFISDNIYIFINIYIEREREEERCVCVCVCAYLTPPSEQDVTRGDFKWI